MVAMELASLSSEVGMEEFTRRYNLLKSVRDMWTSGKDAALCQCPGMHACSNHILLLEVIYTAAQDQHCNGETDARSIPITADQCSVDSISEGDQRVPMLIQVLLKM